MVDPARALGQGGLEQVGAVGGEHERDIGVLTEPVHLVQQLEQQRVLAGPRNSSPVSTSLGLWTAESPNLARWDIPAVIHFSTTAPVHSCALVYQHVYRNHPQSYAQSASLAGPGAGVI